MWQHIFYSLTVAVLMAGPLAPDTHAIYGGRPPEASDVTLRSVVKLEVQTKSWTGYCSGVIVARNEIATAAHCLFEDERALEPVAAASVSVRYHHGKSAGKVARMRINRVIDLAVLTTVADHPAPVTILQQDLRSAEQIAQQSSAATFIFLGYGQSGDASAALTGLQDSPLTLRTPDSVQLRMLHPNFPAARGTCSGDSGGPVLIKDGDGPAKLIGIHQAGHKESINYAIEGSNGNCSRVSYFSPMARLATWENEMREDARVGYPPRIPSLEIIRLGKDTKRHPKIESLGPDTLMSTPLPIFD